MPVKLKFLRNGEEYTREFIPTRELGLELEVIEYQPNNIKQLGVDLEKGGKVKTYKHSDKLKVYTGVVKAFAPVSNMQVQIELVDVVGIFELVIDQSWVVMKGDCISLSGIKDDTGKVVCLAYKNHTKDVVGYNVMTVPTGSILMICLAILFLLFSTYGSSVFLGSIAVLVIGVMSFWSVIKKNSILNTAVNILPKDSALPGSV